MNRSNIHSLRRAKAIATAVCVCCTTSLIAAPGDQASHATAGLSNAQSGSGSSSENNPGLIGREASDSGDNPGLNSDNNRGNADGEFGRTPATQAASNGSEHRKVGGGFFHVGREEVMEARGEKSESGKAEKTSEKSEVTTRFESSLLYAGITPAPSETPTANQFGATNNPGLEHVSRQGLTSSESGRSTAEAARSDTKASPESSVSPATTQLTPGGSPAESPGVGLSPSASPSVRPSATFVPGSSPVPSAPESHGINPVPSATVTANR